MGESKEIQVQNFYGKFLLNLLMKGKPLIQITPEGVKRNFLKKSVSIPWSEIKTVFEDWKIVPNSFTDYYIIGITTTNQYAFQHYKKIFSVKQLIRKNKPYRYSRGILNNFNESEKIIQNLQKEKIVIYIYRNQLKKNGKDLFSILQKNFEITKTGFTYIRP
ncbi:MULTISPECIES: hypothetical protein [unclassified Enterococcus]|uniref:hypothetical protein n=1 Tax=unclassified Enterococcus TaxID=2608891 RepID=UPI001551E207|nr:MULTISPECIES: hypothetical protein [unclassified Enterococcus]MBS7577163.1 hypothetical protein [Enterococcus sp. MMGLQ5-2]MBS7584390.1 hypothetical protein [Enterococcus sp. MMGLQ5-1]NPD12245.1 hypothetical protein [Enterococcus sp. MMGLQ5-1]NPD36997.1 hypothetical protein [Enterococcus sp. MMGLQ5-2]